MARRGWGVSIVTALGVAAGTGAAQLGFGYGLGIITWTAAGAARVDAAWVASLAWATWISATSVVAGAVCAHRLRGDDDEPGRTLRHLTLAVAAGVGALITVLLVAVPARAARVPETFSPQTVAAGYAAAGLLTGLLLAVWALHSRAAADNLVATTGWLWLLAVVSVVDGVLSGRGLTTAQLGIWQLSADRGSFWIRDYFYWPGAVLSLGSALVIGVLAARRTAGVPRRRIGAAASGAAGPFLVALAYLLAVPRLAGIAPEQVSAHLLAPYAVIAGIGGSVLVAALAQRAELRAAGRAEGSLPRQRTEAPTDPSDQEPGRPPAEAVVAGDEATSRRWRFGRRPAGPTEPAAEPATRAGHSALVGPAPTPGHSPLAGPEPAVEPPTVDGTTDEPVSGRSGPRTTRTPESAGAPDAEPGAGGVRSTRSRAASGRGRAIPPQRKPSDPPIPADAPEADGGDGADPAGTPDGASEGTATTPTGGPKARRRSR